VGNPFKESHSAYKYASKILFYTLTLTDHKELLTLEKPRGILSNNLPFIEVI
jgi:hypothetical protein